MDKKKLTPEEMDALNKQVPYIKVNLPPTFEEYQSGNGEGIWALTESKEVYDKWDADEAKGQFVAYAANDSVYYPDLKCGCPVLCEFRGGNRPVAVWDNLHGTKEAATNQKKVMKKLGGRCPGQ